MAYTKVKAREVLAAMLHVQKLAEEWAKENRDIIECEDEDPNFKLLVNIDLTRRDLARHAKEVQDALKGGSYAIDKQLKQGLYEECD